MKIFSSLFVFLFCLNSLSNLQKMTEDFFKKRKVNLSSLGIYIQTGGKSLVQINPSKKMVPASSTKLVTAASLLKYLKAHKRFETQIYTDQRLNEKEVLNLYIKGGGDASFTTESMYLLVQKLKKRGIKKIKKNIILDNSYYKEIKFPVSRSPFSMDEQRAYKAPISPLSFNWNSVGVHVFPGFKKGSKARIFIDPAIDFFFLINKTKTVSGDKTKIKVQRRIRKKKHIITVQGSIGLKAKEKMFYRSVTLPSLFFGKSFVYFLKEQGIEFTGRLKKGKTPKNLSPLITHKSKSLKEQIRLLLEYSNNLISDSLYQNLYEELSWNKKLSPLNFYLEKEVGLKYQKDFNLLSPSGLSRKNKITAKALAKTLNHIKKDFHLFPEISSSLAVPQSIGTLKDRMEKMGSFYGLRMKTGFLNGISSLAGYLASEKDGKIYQVVILFNGSYKKAFSMPQIIDDYCFFLKSRL